jgi:ATP-dependent helicase/nuclease subunit B
MATNRHAPSRHLVPSLVEALGDHCRRHLLAEKWLLAPSLRVGRQWVEQVVRGGVPVVNLHVQTLARLARDLCEAVRPGVEFVSPRGGIILLDRLLGRLRQAESSYLAALRPSAGLAQGFHDSLCALRLAGVGDDRLDGDSFEHPGKGAELRKLLGAYLAELQARNQADAPDCLGCAIGGLTANPALLPPGLIVLVPDDLPLSQLERALLDALPTGICRALPTDPPGAPPAGQALTDATRLCWLAASAEAPPPRQDSTAAIFRAVGEANEVREVLRRCLATGLRLDEVELLHTDRDVYVPLIYELFAKLCAGDGPSERPVTFAEGIPVRYARPGRALALWLRWITTDFPQAILVNLIQEALLEVPQPATEPASFTRLANWLRVVPIGLGRERYLDLIDEQCAALAAPATADPDEEEPDAGREVARAQRRRGLVALRGVIAELLHLAPSPQADAREVLSATEAFLRYHARAVSELDRNARGRLLVEVRDLAHWVGQDDEPISLDVRAWLAALPGECRVLGSVPRPGCLHVAHVNSGGHSGRPHLFVVGLDDGRFPGAGLQDPVLLDSERRRLSADLPTAAGRLRDKLDGFARLLARHRGTVTLSYSCTNLRDDRETFPSPVVLSAYRILSGNVEGDQSDLLAWLSPPASFAPARSEGCLDGTEWWLWQLCGPERPAGADGLVAACFPHLGRGFKAARQRAGDALTAFDGLVPEAGWDHDPLAADGPVMSARRLETIGRCPRAYFFQYLLKLEPPQELALDPTRWLDPLAFGALLHEVFEQFYTELLSQDRAPEFTRDWPRLTEVLDERVAVYRRRFPSPSESVFRRQYRELQQTARLFLLEEEDHARTAPWRPAYLEAAIGMPNPGRGTALDSTEPVTLSLPGDRRFRARAWIDRLDRFLAGADPVFAVWDYKTGSTWKYEQADPFWQGRVVQNSLYLLVAAARLRQAVSPQARVAQFGYFFPGAKGRGERIVWSMEELAGAGEVLLRLCQVAGQGVFLPTNDHKTDCTYCNYRPICGDVQAVAASSQAKLDNSGNVVLQPFLKLRESR